MSVQGHDFGSFSYFNPELSFTKETWTIQEQLNQEIHSKVFFTWIWNNHMFIPVPGVNEQLHVSSHVGFNTAKVEEASTWTLAWWPRVAIALFPVVLSLSVQRQALFSHAKGHPPSYLKKMPSRWEVHLVRVCRFRPLDSPHHLANILPSS